MSSRATTTVSAVNPCRTAFRRDRRLLASVFGPVLLSAYLGWPRSVETRSLAWTAIGSFAGGAPRTDAWIKGRAGWALLGRFRCGCRPKLGASADRDGRAIDPRVLP